MAPNLTFGVAQELDLVEKRLRECSLTDVETLSEIASYVVNSGGKRIRPIVTLLSFRAVGGTEVKKAVDMATAIELIHTGSLIHDDINDGGELRRGRMSALKKFGLEDSLVTGDFLFSKVFELGGQFGEDVILITADACSSLPSGEVLQRRFRFDTSITVDQYVDMTERKTARLMSAGARSGALIGNGTPEQIKRLGEYGKNLGITFQIIDDILDVVGSEEKLGKKIGSDIREGNITLLSIYAMSNGNEISREELASILRKDTKSEDEVGRTLELIRDMGGPDRAFQEAKMYAQRAKDQISVFDNEYREGLEELVDYSLNRES
jgi:octaprenyl-diphosphate synthase